MKTGYIGRKYLLPILSFAGLLFAVFMVIYGMRKPPVPPIEFPPPIPPYKHYVAGAGTVEAASRDISIGTPFNELVTEIFVKVGDFVREGTPLFHLDTRDLEARLKEAKERLNVAKTNFDDQEKQFTLYQSLRDKRAVSENEFNQRFYAAEGARNELEEAAAAVDVIATNIERSIIRAPIDGQVLQVNIRIGEVVERNPFDLKAHVLFGSIFPLHIRVDIDEDDAWRIVPEEPAIAYVRGNSSICVPLKFLYIEPFILPKQVLTGDNSERVDTRVLQVLYAFERDDLPIYVGQVMDVYIKGLPSDERF